LAPSPVNPDPFFEDMDEAPAQELLREGEKHATGTISKVYWENI